MSNSDLTLFKEKFNTSDYFVGVAESLIDRLLEFEYIPTLKLNSYINKLFNNINELRIDTNNNYEYKTGYYDANKKELYIKDTKNIPAVYLRLLYALTTNEVDNNIFNTGYATTKLHTENYKLRHINFGINRAIMSNLVYKLCNLIPASLQIPEINPTYTHNFLGFKIESQNDMYYLEGKILSELCFVLDLDPELLYHGLFTKRPIKVLQNAFKKKDFKRSDEFLDLLDNISRKYSNYNKLLFLSNKLNDNYINYKKNVLTTDVKDIKKEQQIIEQEISSVLSNLKALDENDSKEWTEENYEESSAIYEHISGLAETIDNLYNSLRNDIIIIQDILAEQLIESSKNLSYSRYASKLKCFNNILIAPNKKLNKKIEELILFKLMPESEITGINLIEKIKYALIEQILSEEDFADISNTFSFFNITQLENANDGSCIIILNSNKAFAKVLEISGLNNNDYNYTITPIPLDNLKHMMTSSYSNIYVGNIEKLYSSLKNSFKQFENLSLENIFAFEYESKKLLLVYTNDTPHIISFSTQQIHNFQKLYLSEKYKVFGKTITKEKINNKSNLPIIYKK